MSETTTNPTTATPATQITTVYTIGYDYHRLNSAPSLGGPMFFSTVAWVPSEADVIPTVETHYRKLDPSAAGLWIEVLANLDRSMLCVDVRDGAGVFNVLASYRVARGKLETAGIEGSPLFGIVEPPKPVGLPYEAKLAPRDTNLSPRAETIQFLKAQGTEVRI